MAETEMITWQWGKGASARRDRWRHLCNANSFSLSKLVSNNRLTFWREIQIYKLTYSNLSIFLVTSLFNTKLFHFRCLSVTQINTKMDHFTCFLRTQINTKLHYFTPWLDSNQGRLVSKLTTKTTAVCRTTSGLCHKAHAAKMYDSSSILF